MNALSGSTPFGANTVPVTFVEAFPAQVTCCRQRFVHEGLVPHTLGVPAPPLNLVNAGRLIAYLDDSWDKRRSIRTRITESLPSLQERARETHRLLLEVLTGEKARDAHAKAA